MYVMPTWFLVVGAGGVVLFGAGVGLILWLALRKPGRPR
jgi:hypothetical protein